MRTRLWQLTVAALVVGLLGLAGTVPPAAADEGPAVAGTPAPNASPGPESADNTEAPKQEVKGEQSAETPEISVEVVGKKWGEQVVPALVPSTGEVVSTISAEEIKSIGESTVADTVQFLPSVQVVRQGRLFERLITVRGGSVPTVLLDGVQISAASGGFNSGFANRALYSIPLSMIERIEVIRSNSSLIYGPQAIAGGVINLVTKKGTAPPRVEPSLEFGSYGRSQQTFAHFDGTDDRGIALALQREANDSNLEFGGQRMNHIYFRSDRTLGNGDTARFFLLTNEGERRLDVWSPEFQQVAKRGPAYWELDPWRERFGSFTYTHPLSGHGAGLDMIVWWRNRFFRQDSYAGPLAPPKKEGTTVLTDTKDDTIGTSLFWRQPLGPSHYLRAGMQWYRLNGFEQNTKLTADGITPVKAPATDTDYELTGYFAQDEWSLSTKTKLSWGGRYETPKDRDHAFVYALGLEHGLSNRTAFSARLGTGVEFPTYDQLASDPTLKDKTSQNLDVGVDHYFRPNLLGRLCWFRTAIDNEFITYLKDGGDPANSADYLTTQADQTTSGLEMELQGGSSSLNWYANWTKLNRDVGRTPVIGDRPLQLAIPPDSSLNFGVRWRPHDRLRLGITHRYVSDYLARARYFSGGWPIDAYQVSNLTASYRLGNGWDVSAGLSNLFDEQYETQPGFPMPGRNFVVGIVHTAEIRAAETP